MNKFFNVLLLVVFFPTMLLAIVVGFDIPLTSLHTSGANITYKKEIFLVLGVFLLLINLRRSIRRWVAMKLVNQQSKYKWSTVVSKDRIKRVYSYNFLEALVMLAGGIGVYLVTSEAWMPLVGLAFGALDGIFFAVYGANSGRFRVGLTSKALLAGDRDVVLIYFLGLRRVSFQQQTLFFDFKEEGMQFRFPIILIPEEKREEFFSELKETVDNKKVYFSNNIEFHSKKQEKTM